jgi:hypothetical protein
MERHMRRFLDKAFRTAMAELPSRLDEKGKQTVLSLS